MDTADWSFREGPEFADEAGRALDALVGQIQNLESVLRSPPMPIHPDSALAGDDLVMAPLHVSATAWTPLFIALDHLTLHGATLREVSRIQPTSSYALLRPAIEGAAWAIWILAPTRRDERVLRALQYVLLDEGGFRRLVTASGAEPGHTLEEARADLVEIVARCPSIAKADLRATPTAGPVIEIASREVGVGAEHALLFWTALSGLAHGRPHGIMALLQREQLYVGTHGERGLLIEPSLATIANGTRLALAFVETALNLYTSRCSAPGGVVVPHT